MFLKDLQEEDFEIAVKVKNIPFLRNLFHLQIGFFMFYKEKNP